jgi:hypothetical protein
MSARFATRKSHSPYLAMETPKPHVCVDTRKQPFRAKKIRNARIRHDGAEHSVVNRELRRVRRRENDSWHLLLLPMRGSTERSREDAIVSKRRGSREIEPSTAAMAVKRRLEYGHAHSDFRRPGRAVRCDDGECREPEETDTGQRMVSVGSVRLRGHLSRVSPAKRGSMSSCRE